MKSPTTVIVKIFPVTLFIELVLAFSPVSLKVVLKAGHKCTLEKNRSMKAKESRSRNLMRLSEQFLESISVFKEASRNFLSIFLLTRQARH